MIKLFKETFKTSNDSIILAIPLILFMWMMSIYLAFSSVTVDVLPEFILAVVTMLFMAGAFMAGWFYMVKKAINIVKGVYVMDEDRAKATINLFKVIPSGIGKYFLSFIGMAIIFLLAVSVVGAGVYKIGMHFIGNIDFTAVQIKGALVSAQDMKAFLDTLTLEQLWKLNNWNMLFLGATSLMSFLFMLWVPEIIYSTPNPFLALFKSIKKLFIKLGKSLGLFFYLTLLNFTISFVSTFAMINPFIYLFIMILYFYLITYMVVLIFSYYQGEFCEQPAVEGKDLSVVDENKQDENSNGDAED